MATIASLIVDISANTANLVKGAEDTNKNLDKIATGAGKLAGLLGITFSTQAAINFAKEVFNVAGEIQDLSQQIGISTDAVQGFKYAAEQSGATLNDVGAAIQRMNNNLVGGDRATVKALQDAGLSFANIRNMRPEDAFLAIADAIQDIPDPMVQSNVALTLFGKSAGTLLPAIKEGFRQTSESAAKMSRETIEALDKAGDAWATVGNKIVVVSGTAIAKSMEVTGAVTKNWGAFATMAKDTIELGVAGAWMKAAKAAEEVERKTKLGHDTNLAYIPTVTKTKDELDAASKAAAAHAKELQSIRDKLTGAGLIKAATDYTTVLRTGVPVQKMTEEAQADINKTMKAALDVYTAQGRVAPQAMRDLYIATMPLIPVVNGLGDNWKKFGEHIDVSIPKMKTFSLEVVSGLNSWGEFGLIISKPTVPEAIKKNKDAIGDLAKALAQMAQIGGESFGTIVRGLATMVSAYDAAIKSQKALNEGIDSFKAGDKLQGIAGIATGVMGVASAAIAGAQAFKQMWDHFFGHAGRDVVVKFAESMGGFDAMHAKLLTLGQKGEDLWIKLTQGVGRNNPAEAKRVIEEINAALAGQDAWMSRLPALIDRYGLSWEQAGIKARQAHMDDIAKGLIQDFADLTKAGFDVEVITVAMSDAINDYLHNAIRTGTEVPAAMRPILQKMIDLGLLTDDAGVKLEDLSSITFATTLTQGFKDVVDAIHDLTRALGGAGAAIDDLNNRRVRIPVEEAPGDEGDPPAASAARFSPTRGLSIVSRGGGGSSDGGGASIDRHFLLEVVPKAIVSAMQKGAA